MKISVAIATFNGEEFIAEQLNSILKQLTIDDEIIISDDGSTDNTTHIVASYILKDSRIRLVQGPKKGFVKNFENALKHTTGDIIFLSDQDDIWMEDKVKSVLSHFTNDTKVVLHNFINFQHNSLSLQTENIINYKKGLIKNLLYSSYWGCCLAFTREFKNQIIPFPKKLISHDQYIGLIAEHEKNISFIDEPLIYHREHSNNQSKSRKLKEKISFRIKMLKSFVEYRFT